MLKFSNESLKTCEMQMFNKARDLDVALFNVLFSNDMPKMFVSTALSGYQNSDGGFAHALEIDNYNKDSSVYQVYEALRIVKQAGFKNIKEDETLEAMMKKAFNYLYNRLDNWCAIIPSNNQAVCASWFKYNETNIKNFGDAPTPAIVGLTLYLTDEKSPYNKMAMKKAKDVIAKLLNKTEFTNEEILSYKEFLDCIKEKGLFKDDEKKMSEIIFNASLKMAEHNKDNFNKYCILPLELFDEYTDNEEVNKMIDDNLDFLIESLPKHGLWEPNFEWMNEYPEASTAQIKWMGPITIRNLLWLKKFNRLGD